MFPYYVVGDYIGDYYISELKLGDGGNVLLLTELDNETEVTLTAWKNLGLGNRNTHHIKLCDGLNPISPMSLRTAELLDKTGGIVRPVGSKLGFIENMLKLHLDKYATKRFSTEQPDERFYCSPTFQAIRLSCGCCVIIHPYNEHTGFFDKECESIVSIELVRLTRVYDMGNTSILPTLSYDTDSMSKRSKVFRVGEKVLVDTGSSVEESVILAKDIDGYVVEYKSPIGKHSYDGAGKSMYCDIVPSERLSRVSTDGKNK